MSTSRTAPRSVKASGIVLIVVVGLLNFHIPHFLIQSPASDFASALLEMVFLANAIGALVAAVAIYRDLRWAWLLGLAVVSLSVLLYLLQETVGLPGLPRAWLEPSRIVSLLVEAVFTVLAVSRLVGRLGPTPGQPDSGAAGRRSHES